MRKRVQEMTRPPGITRSADIDKGRPRHTIEGFRTNAMMAIRIASGKPRQIAPEWNRQDRQENETEKPEWDEFDRVHSFLPGFLASLAVQFREGDRSVSSR